MKQRISLEMGEFALNALAERPYREAVGEPVLLARVVRAIRYYLCDSNAERVEWPYPGFLHDGESPPRVEMTFEVDAKLWADFERESERQGVPVERLAEHAALYFAADRDAGRVTERILADMEVEG